MAHQAVNQQISQLALSLSEANGVVSSLLAPVVSDSVEHLEGVMQWNIALIETATS